MKSYDFICSSGIKYNAEKEEKAKQEKKQRQLDAVELARQLEEEKKRPGMVLPIYMQFSYCIYAYDLFGYSRCFTLL